MTDDLGVYIHIPFCASRCDYCAFVTYVGVDDLHERYVDGVLREIEINAELQEKSATSIYVGGGTPSRIDPTLLGKILAEIKKTSYCEVSVEVNPEDATAERLGSLVDAGVTRFSVGVQSTQEHVLKDLGRQHCGGSVKEIADIVADSGVATWSMDLIAGATSERDADLQATLEDVLDHESAPPHLSCYLLSVEKGTPLSRDPARHPDDDTLARRYEIVDTALEERGYEWYEVSNWSKPGHESRHNQLYWDQGNYVGLGAGAHSHHNGYRSWNVANLDTYLKGVESGVRPRGGDEQLSIATQDFEALALQIRTRKGVQTPKGFNPDALHGFVVKREGRVVLTQRGRLMANQVTRLLSEQSEEFSLDLSRQLT